MKKYMALLSLLALFTVGFAQGTDEEEQNREFEIDVQLRPRGEYRDGYTNPLSTNHQPAGFISTRARLGIGYKSDFITLKVSGQQTGVWGSEAPSAKYSNLYLNEAYARVNTADKKFFFSVGMQVLSYDDERILGAEDWEQAGHSHEALKLGFENKEDKVHLIVAFNQNDEKFYGTYYNNWYGQPYKSMQTIWYHHQFTDAKLGVSLLAMNLGFESGVPEQTNAWGYVEALEHGDTKYMQTMGGYISFHPGKWNLSASGYYQMGRSVAQKKDIAAYMWSITGAYSLNRHWSLGAGIDFRSGDDGKGNKCHSFDQLYGSHHEFYGAMDYFCQYFKPGLLDPRGKITYKQNQNLGISAEYHYFLSNTPIVIMKEERRTLGQELDIQMNWKLADNVTLEGGFSVMMSANAMDAVKVASGMHRTLQNCGWLSVNVNPTIFKTIF